jgi:hypothetical protein
MKEANVILIIHEEFDTSPGNWMREWATRAIAAGIITKEMCKPIDFRDLISISINELIELGHLKSWKYAFLDTNMLNISGYYETDEDFAKTAQYLQEKTAMKLESARINNVELILILD